MKFLLLQLGLLAMAIVMVDAAARLPICKPAAAVCKKVPAASAKACKSIICK